MNPYVSITCRTITIWIMAAVINGLLCGIYIGVSGHENDPIPLLIFFAGLCSLFFGAPGFFVFWITMLVMISRKLSGRSLFRAALSTGIILASGTAFFSIEMFSHSERLAISLFIILSAITSIMMHFNLFKKIGSDKSQEKLQLKYNQTD